MSTATPSRASLAVSVVLIALLLASGVSAWLLGSRTFDGIAPAGAPRALAAQGAGESEVELSADARRHPAAGAVREQLQLYFDAINARDYALWASTVVPERVAQQPQAQWLAAIDSTSDGTIRVDRIDDLGDDGVLVLVRFVSTQSLSHAPPDLQAGRICWRGTLPMSGSPLRLGTGNAGSMLSEAC